MKNVPWMIRLPLLVVEVVHILAGRVRFTISIRAARRLALAACTGLFIQSGGKLFTDRKKG